MKNYLKRTTTFLLALLMLLSVPLQAFAGVNHEDLTKDKAEIINKKEPPLNPAKLEGEQTAADLIKNPDQPAIYTLRTDYKVQRGDKYEVDYQPYIASVGANATQTEKDKVNQTVKLPDLTGYEKPEDDYLITYDKVMKAGNNGNQEFRYKAKANAITIKHVFQALEDFSKYTNPDGSVGEEGQLITTQNGNTGSTMEVSPLNDNHPNRKGFVPEAPFITMQVPENAENFILEYRYNRAHYDVVFDTAGGTPVPSRTLYYEQTIPKIAEADIPKKEGCIFQGWKPSVELKNGNGKIFKADEIIKYKEEHTNPVNDLDVNLKMPASKITFTAVWKDKEKADYAIQFWAEKADHADDASIMDKYDYMGTRVYKDQDTGMRPDLDNEPVTDVVFPDLDQARLQKIWNGEKFNRRHDLYLNKFYVYNQDLTHDQNKDPKDVNLVKSVDATGKTVYNIYYDRQVYDLYFTKSNAQPEKNTFYPEIWQYDEAQGEAVMKGGPGNLYHYKARFNEMMYKWPNDAKQTKGFTPGYQSFGWGPNYKVPNWPLHLDTPPYRLNADEFLDMVNYDNWGGYVNSIDDGAGGTIDASDFRTLSFGIKQDKPSIPHHMDFWMDGFKDGETIIRYDLVRTKADTAAPDYGHRYPRVQGFTPHDYEPGNPQSAWPVIKEGSEENGRVNEEEINDLNDERDEITLNTCGTYYNNNGIKLPIGQLDFIPHFFSDSDDYGDVKEGGQEFTVNGYLQFHYKRNKYPLRFNYDPSIIRDDSYFNSKNQLDTFYEFPLKALSPDLVDDSTPQADREYFKDKPANLLDNPENLQQLGLTELVFNDPNDNNKLKVKRPDNLSDQMVFKGWALDPAGTKLIWENPKETMPTHALNLYAKWGEPDYQWKVTFDPNGGNLRSIKEENLTTSRKTIQVGDIVQDETKTFPIKETNDGNKQVFTVIQRQKLVEPNFKPTRKGYDFMGWEVIRYKKDANTGDYTTEIDDSYRKTYKVPELYSFGNDVVSPIYLKAIWVPNQRVDVKIEHYFLDDDYKLDENEKPNPKKDTLEDKRSGYLVAATGDRQDDKYLLAPHDELDKKLTGDLKKEYEDYNKRVGLNNTFFQTFRVEPEKILNTETNQMEENPKAKNNVFKFFYRPFRQREYKVNYIDERFKAEVEKFFKGLNLTDTSGLKDDALLTANEENKKKFEAKRPDFEELIKKYQIIDPEAVSNGNRHFDARNYRPIPGWVLTSPPQQQLFFDVNEKTNDFLGINGTGGDQIFFYYKDVRVIEVPGKDNPPEGYVRVTFKADKGGSFGKDAQGNDITELNYDVIKGLKSDLLPVPKELGTKADGTPNDKEDGKYYITPETGKKFIKWDEKPLLNKNTIIENETKDFYVFTAKFEWSGLTASGLVRTEAFKDDKADGTKDWSNKFAPTIDELKAQLVWKEKDQEKPLPAGTEIKFFYKDEEGIEKELKTDEDIFKLVNEQNKADKDQLVRTVNIKAKVTFKDGKEPQELTIPITVYKNVYEALNKNGDKPLFLKEAEGKEAKDGGLKDVTGDYVMVTIKASKDFNAKDDKIYYVNKNAWVEIPEVKTEGSSTFVNWTADKDAQNEGQVENGIFKFGKRHKFTEDTIITPVGAGDVVEQKQGEDKPKVPDNYVKVIVKTTDKATDDTAFEKTFWVNPTADVTIGVTNPTGKTVEADPAYPGTVGYTMNFSKWESNEKTARTWTDNIVGKFEKDTTIIAKYSIDFKEIKDIDPTADKVHTPKGKKPTVDEIKDKITPPEGKTIKNVKIVENPKVDEPGESKVKVIVEYTDGSSVGTTEKPVEIQVKVHEPVVPAKPDGTRPEEALENYVKVIFKAGEGGSLSGDLVYYVSPEVEVDMTKSAGKITKTPDIGYVSGDWDTSETKKLRDTFKVDTEFTFNFIKSEDMVEKTDENTKKPDGYVTITFKTDSNGKVNGKDVIIYYVNPDAGIKLGKSAGDKILVVPTPTANANYVFNGWQESIDENTPITNDRTHVAIFQAVENKVTLTYDAGGATGDVPEKVEVKAGTTVNLARPEGLSKENATFAGWKLDEDEKIYKPGDQVKLEKARTATAQWTTDKHKVEFDTVGGSKAPDTQFVEHNGRAKKPADPTKENFVFLGWKENSSDADYFDFENKPIDKDIVLHAQWTDAVEKINDGGSIDTEKFIKVTFKQGDHGKLKLADTEQTSPVTYKVAKGISFAEAKAAGLEVPEIAPAKYYKTKDTNESWDKALDLTLEAGETEKIFTAQYEPEADVIPVDPEVTDDEEIQKEKPEGMVLVQFKVPEDKAFMTGDSKFYVKANTDVEIDTPVVHKLTLENDEVNDYEFKSWDMTKGENDKWTYENGKWKFEQDTIIGEEEKERPDIQISRPVPKANNIIISVLTDGAKGYLEITGDGIPNNTRIEASKRGRMNIFYINKVIGRGLKRDDVIKIYAVKDGIKSEEREYIVK